MATKSHRYSRIDTDLLYLPVSHCPARKIYLAWGVVSQSCCTQNDIDGKYFCSLDIIAQINHAGGRNQCNMPDNRYNDRPEYNFFWTHSCSTKIYLYMAIPPKSTIWWCKNKGRDLFFALHALPCPWNSIRPAFFLDTLPQTSKYRLTFYVLIYRQHDQRY